MECFHDREVGALYILARDSGGALIQHDQRVAIQHLGSLARGGNREAGGALAALLRTPDLHPLLMEIVVAESGIPVQTGT